MSYEFPFDPQNQTVPNVITAKNQVDIPTRTPNVLRNPDIAQLGLKEWDQVVPFTCTADAIKNALIPFTPQQQQAWDADLAAKAKSLLVSDSLHYLTGSDPISILIQAMIQEMPLAQGLPASVVSAAIEQNIQAIANGVIIKP